MILVLAGTSDGRELAEMLADQGYQVLASVTSEYGAALAQIKGIDVITGKLDTEGLIRLIKEKEINILIDATHPFAENASKNAIVACENTSARYLRYERPAASFENSHLVKTAGSYLEAAEIANDHRGNVFLTTGSNHLDLFVKKITDKSRIVARVLPSAEVMKKCLELGLEPCRIIAMQGPFGRDLNREMFRHYEANLIITKESGSIGGTDEKILAAQDLGIPVVVITRPKLQYPCLVSDKEEVLERIKVWER